MDSEQVIRRADRAAPTVVELGDMLVSRLENLGRKRSTIETVESHLRIHIAPWFGEVGVDAIDDGKVEAFIAFLRRNGSAAKTARNVMGTLHSLFELARRRNGKRLVSSVDKANVLETSQLWREVVTEVAAGYPDVRLEHVLVDNAAMALIRRPNELDVLVTENTFGDILTDEASMLTGSIGLLASSSTGERRNRHGGLFGLYEPIHGTAPDIAGTQSANPIGSIGCVAMMLRESFGLEAEAAAVERAVEEALARGLRTPDLRAAGERAVTTSELGSAIADAIRVSTAV